MSTAIDRLFDIMLQEGASDLHLSQGQPPKLRLHGRIQAIAGEAMLDEIGIKALLQPICPDDRWQHFLACGDLDFAHEKGKEARFRANYYRHEHGMGAVFRIIPTRIMTMDELNLPPVLKRLCHLQSGLVLVTGPTGSGKSTTLAAMIDHINRHQKRHILTIEEPIEFVYDSVQSVFCQREVGSDVPSFNDGLRVAGRQDLDVVLVGEMRDYETISLALEAASMGPLVFGTLHTNSAVKTVDRIIDAFPASRQGQARTLLADSLKGVVAQLLLKTADGKGRVACNEILLGSTALAASIRDGKTGNIRNIISGGKSRGMQMMDDVLMDYIDQGLISGQEAYMKANDKKKFIRYQPGSEEEE